MFLINKITLTYDLIQDRVRLAIEDTAGQVMLLWLPRRIGKGLVQVLVEWMERPEVLPDEATVSPGLPRQTALSWEHTTAVEAQGRDTPVMIPSQREEWLIQGIDIKPLDKGVVLIFKSAQDRKARLTLGRTALHQWLGSLRSVFEQAQWDIGHWPPWLAPQAEESRESIVIH